MQYCQAKKLGLVKIVLEGKGRDNAYEGKAAIPKRGMDA